MFTGIIQAICNISRIVSKSSDSRIIFNVEKNILSLLENEKERKLIGLNGFNIIKKYPQINFTKSILNSEIS